MSNDERRPPLEEPRLGLCNRRGVVLLVGDVLAPSHGGWPVSSTSCMATLGHEAVGGCAMTLVLARFEVDAVAWLDDLDRSAPPLAAADALGDLDGLP
jgi:hypothetical protein